MEPRPNLFCIVCAFSTDRENSSFLKVALTNLSWIDDILYTASRDAKFQLPLEKSSKEIADLLEQYRPPPPVNQIANEARTEAQKLISSWVTTVKQILADARSADSNILENQPGSQGPSESVGEPEPSTLIKSLTKIEETIDGLNEIPVKLQNRLKNNKIISKLTKNV